MEETERPSPEELARRIQDATNVFCEETGIPLATLARFKIAPNRRQVRTDPDTQPEIIKHIATFGMRLKYFREQVDRLRSEGKVESDPHVVFLTNSDALKDKGDFSRLPPIEQKLSLCGMSMAAMNISIVYWAGPADKFEQYQFEDLLRDTQEMDALRELHENSADPTETPEHLSEDELHNADLIARLDFQHLFESEIHLQYASDTDLDLFDRVADRLESERPRPPDAVVRFVPSAQEVVVNGLDEKRYGSRIEYAYAQLNKELDEKLTQQVDVVADLTEQIIEQLEGLPEEKTVGQIRDELETAVVEISRSIHLGNALHNSHDEARKYLTQVEDHEVEHYWAYRFVRDLRSQFDLEAVDMGLEVRKDLPRGFRKVVGELSETMVPFDTTPAGLIAAEGVARGKAVEEQLPPNIDPSDLSAEDLDALLDQFGESSPLPSMLESYLGALGHMRRYCDRWSLSDEKPPPGKPHVPKATRHHGTMARSVEAALANEYPPGSLVSTGKGLQNGGPGAEHAPPA